MAHGKVNAIDAVNSANGGWSRTIIADASCDLNRPMDEVARWHRESPPPHVDKCSVRRAIFAGPRTGRAIPTGQSADLGQGSPSLPGDAPISRVGVRSGQGLAAHLHIPGRRGPRRRYNSIGRSRRQGSGRRKQTVGARGRHQPICSVNAHNTSRPPGRDGH